MNTETQVLLALALAMILVGIIFAAYSDAATLFGDSMMELLNETIS